ncbi:putative imidazolonepropionase [Acropora cervicornis]|uniref:Probable imidazolonepropionase n=1 Tax=Acropora cervicornis TaxID=6130 RepID=A0AAD9R1N2_ACRCE|nr:putative imidazolonepropionase [Acropora cervicornis]
MYKLRIRHARQVVLVCNNRERILIGKSMRKLAIVEAGQEGGVSVVVNNAGKIECVDQDEIINQNYKNCSYEEEIDATGMCVLPGLIDGHTHPVWVGDRVHEFAMKLAGATYMDVHNAGGGIGYTVEHVRRASEEELYSSLRERLLRMLRTGTTLVEAKSGYGLDTESEMKMLRVIERAKKDLPIEISSTFCGAHSVPKGSSAEEATNNVINYQIPKLQELIQSQQLRVDNIDVFCEKGVFGLDDTRKILEAGKAIGLAVNFHGDELHPMKAAEVGARAISHLEEVSEDGIQGMAEASVIAVLLPTTAYILRLKCPPARKMIESGVPVALGSDFNPNAFCLSMPLTMHLACVNLRMTMEESLVAATLNAAASLGRSHTHGSLERGKMADMLVINAPRWEHLVYQLGGHDELIMFVIKKGSLVYKRP